MKKLICIAAFPAAAILIIAGPYVGYWLYYFLPKAPGIEDHFPVAMCGMLAALVFLVGGVLKLTESR
jgi:hypothetical protein